MHDWDARLAPFRLDSRRRWTTLAVAGWGAVAVAFLVLFIVSPNKVTGFAPYLRGAEGWLEGAKIYSFKANKGFVYSPLAAVFFTPFTFVPTAVANVVWRFLSLATLLGGLWSVLRFGPFTGIPPERRGLVFLLLLPLSLSNLDAGQANPIVIGLLMAGLAAAGRQHWTLAALAFAAAAHWKIYPVVAGLLVLLLAPWRFGWRFVLALALMAALPYLFQETGYVTRQYQLWMETRLADNRLQYDLAIAPLDLWFLLTRVLGVPVSETAYKVLQAGTGLAIAGFCAWGRLHRFPTDRLLGGLFAFVCVWMVLLGPASEWLTYLLLAPAAALAVVDTLPRRGWERAAAWAAYGLLLLAALRVGFVPKWQSPALFALQPLAALCYAAYAVLRYGVPPGGTTTR
jgi:hypothetical protein